MHLAMPEELGANLDLFNLKPWFYCPCDSKQKIVIITGICHAIKLVRNNFANKWTFLNQDSQKIE